MVVKKRGTVKRASPKLKRKPSIPVYRPTGILRSPKAHAIGRARGEFGGKNPAILRLAPRSYIPIARVNSAYSHSGLR